jgi:hypothetical protein
MVMALAVGMVEVTACHVVERGITCVAERDDDARERFAADG